MERILILPDIHGRRFWREAIEENEADRIVFLGDYLDPYSSEGISDDEAIENFKAILEFKDSHKKMVTLLYGNHDLHYISPTFYKYACSPGYMYSRAVEIKELFSHHKKSFQLCCEAKNNNQRVLFSHAGITSVWYNENKPLIGELTVKNLNKLLKSEEGIEILCQVSYPNGGYSPSGSMVWADVKEMINSRGIPGIYQVFGHSLLESGPVILNNFACLDCYRPFLLKCK